MFEPLKVAFPWIICGSKLCVYKQTEEYGYDFLQDYLMLCMMNCQHQGNNKRNVNSVLHN